MGLFQECYPGCYFDRQQHNLISLNNALHHYFLLYISVYTLKTPKDFYTYRIDQQFEQNFFIMHPFHVHIQKLTYFQVTLDAHVGTLEPELISTSFLYPRPANQPRLVVL